mgnify:CR=1 FL=1
MKYEKLSKNALYCMYTAGILTAVVVIAILGAVNYFWIFPKDIEIGKWISLALLILIGIDALISPVSVITDIAIALMKNVLIFRKGICL